MLTSHQPASTSVRRDAWIEVDLTSLENNVRTVRSWLSNTTELMAVVKSDAYGHGAAGVAPVLVAAGARWLGVASVDEGLQLREAGIKAPILILSPCPFWAVSEAIGAALDLSVTAAAQVQDIAREAARLGKVARVHVKVDTGMHRLGAPPGAVPELVSVVRGQPGLHLVGLFSHLAKAEEEESTQRQNAKFKQVLGKVAAAGQRPALMHLASGEAARRFPETHYDMVRVGLYLYGLEPTSVSSVVCPVLSLRARINHLLDIAEGESVGYGLTWTAARPSRLASIPVGYADGVDRGLSNRLKGLLSGAEVPQVGLISMDQMIFDVTDVPRAEVGDVITLIGADTSQDALPARDRKDLCLASWATMLDTITYELACRLRVRLPRMYTRKKKLTDRDSLKGGSDRRA